MKILMAIGFVMLVIGYQVAKLQAPGTSESRASPNWEAVALETAEVGATGQNTEANRENVQRAVRQAARVIPRVAAQARQTYDDKVAPAIEDGIEAVKEEASQQ